MALEVNLQLKLAQKLILTPQLQQAIKLLQMPQLELTQLLNQELVENPVLEETVDEYIDEREVGPEEKGVQEDRTEGRDDSEMPLEQVFTYTSDDYFRDRASDGRDLGYFNPGVDASPTFEQFVSSQPDLTEHLQWQLRFVDESDQVREVSEFIIGNLNDDGYLLVSLEEISEHCKVDLSVARKALDVVQKFDPVGIGARSLQECLLIQVRELGLADTLVGRVLEEGMEELKKRHYQQLAGKLGVPLADVLAAVQAIEALEPRPARNFVSSETTYIVPDVFLVREDDGFRIVLNEEGLPRLRMNNYYRKMLEDKQTLSPSEKSFLEEKMRSAVWLLKSLDQRNKTIYRVTESILKFQDEYFEKGVAYLRPLTLKDVAQDLGMHESTISRVTSNKYIQTPDGLLPFRYFFASSLQSSRGYGEGVASTSVKQMIRKVVSEEDPLKPYSDQKIVEILKSKGVTIARRTVAKYRDEMKIPPQNRRKKLNLSA